MVVTRGDYAWTMPELPEVETVRMGLHSRFVGASIAKAEVYHPRAIRQHLAGPTDFAGRVAGRSIIGTGRRGKFLWLTLEDDALMLCHLGMSGQFLAQEDSQLDHVHLRIRFQFSTQDAQLWFVDQRTFGHVQMSEPAGTVPAAISHIAPDPFEAEFDPERWVKRLSNKRTAIKTALLDQNLVSGIGNIYADEALWRSGIHGKRRADRISAATARQLLTHAKEVMSEAISAGGTSFDELYVNTNGESGYFERRLDAYGRAGQPCRRCQTPMQREVIGGRSSHSCPSCQKQ